MSNCGSVIGGLNCEGFIRDMVGNGYTYQAIASELQRIYPGRVGLSTRSVRRYCSENNIHYSSRLSDQQVEDLVEQAVFQVYTILHSALRYQIWLSQYKPQSLCLGNPTSVAPEC